MTTSFLRLLKFEDKEAALAKAVASLRSGGCEAGIIFRLDPSKFSKVPNSPFAYWSSSQVFEMFSSIPRLASNGRDAQSGASTMDDFRFLRLHWEVQNENIARSREETSYKRWVALSKGGEYQKFFQIPYLLINWKNDGFELKQHVSEYRGQKGWGYNWTAALNGYSAYFRPAITWSRRSQKGISFRALPRGCIFGDKGPVVLVDDDNQHDLSSYLAILNSVLFKSILSMYISFGSWEVGAVEMTPVPMPPDEIKPKLEKLIESYTTILRINEGMVENSPEFSPRAHVVDVDDSITILQELESVVSKLYRLEEIDASPEVNPLFDQEEISTVVDDVPLRLLGQVFGRYDIRIFKDPTLAPSLGDIFEQLPICAPATLVGNNALPATILNIASEVWLRARPNAISLPPEPERSQKISAADYPIEVPWDGILVDDPDVDRDIVARLRVVLAYLHGTEAEAKERELCGELEVKDLRDYLRKPSLFFDTHLKRYSKSRRKAPIYWPLQSRDGRYTIWLYYPRLTADTLYGCSNILESKLKLERRKLELARVDLEKSQGKAERARVEELSDFVAALTEMKEEIERVAGLPYKPDLDDGVQITAAPLWSLFRLPSWQRELKGTWEKLEDGDYDWAHLAYAIWPDRVREKCRKDRSLAIAHRLEDICEQKAPETKVAGKKRGRKPERSAPDEDTSLDFDE